MSDEVEQGADELDDTLAALAEAADEIIHPDRPDNLGQKKTRHDNDGRIVTEVLCKGCEYNLRGQLPEGTCPECGFAIDESLKSDQLRFAEIGWLRSLKFGLSWIIIAVLGGIVANVLFRIMATIVVSSQAMRFTSSSSFGDLGLAIQIVVIMDFIVFITPIVMLCIGFWHLATPDPRAKTVSLPQTLTRWSFIFGYGLIAIFRLYILLSIMTTMDLPESILVVVGLIAGSAIVMFIGFPAMMIYLRSLARRLPSRKLMRQTSIVLWGFFSCFGSLVLLILGTRFVTVLGPNEGVVLLLASPMAIGMVFFSIWWIVLLFVYNGRISKTIGSARRLRRASTPDPSQAHAAVIASIDVLGDDESDVED